MAGVVFKKLCHGEWSMVNGEWSMVNGESEMGNLQFAICKENYELDQIWNLKL